MIAKYSSERLVEETEELDDNWWNEDLDWGGDPGACRGVSPR